MAQDYLRRTRARSASSTIRTRSATSVSPIQGAPAKSLAVNGVPCTARTIRSKSYPLFRYDWGGHPDRHIRTSKVEQFLDWVRTSTAAGQDHQPGRRSRRLQQVGDDRAIQPDRHGRGIPRVRGTRNRVRTSAPSLGSARWSALVVLVLLAMLAFILKEAWPSFSHNGLSLVRARAATSISRSRRSSPPATSTRRRSC